MREPVMKLDIPVSIFHPHPFFPRPFSRPRV
jgi:hypothetical protein